MSRLIALPALLLFIALTAFLPPAPALAADARKPTLTLYTAMTATSPQVPLWAAIHQGWPQGYELKVEYWKNLDDLRGSILADQGDIWVGNLEGFAQAARRDAPLTLVAVTAWRKFWFVAADKEAAQAVLQTKTDEKTGTAKLLADYLAAHKLPLAVGPQDSPAIPVLEDFSRYGVNFKLAPMPPQTLMLEMMRGSRQYALLPEPFVSVLKFRLPSLQTLANLEDEYGRLKGSAGRLPLVGIAVNRRLAEENPALVRELLALMQEAAKYYKSNPEGAAALLPPEVRNTLHRQMIVSSIGNDGLWVTPADEARESIFRFFSLALSPEDSQYLEGLGDKFIFNHGAR